MDNSDGTDQSFLGEFGIYLTVIESNLDLLCHLVGPLLTGEGLSFSPEQEAFADAVDDVLFCTSLAMMARLGELRGAPLSPDVEAKVIAAVRRYEELTEHWRALAQAVDHVWRLRPPPPLD